MPINIIEAEIAEFIDHYLTAPLDPEAVNTVKRIIQKGATASNFPKMVIITFDAAVQKVGVQDAVMNLWLTGFYMGIAFDQRRRELAELKRREALQG